MYRLDIWSSLGDILSGTLDIATFVLEGLKDAFILIMSIANFLRSIVFFIPQPFLTITLSFLVVNIFFFVNKVKNGGG